MGKKKNYHKPRGQMTPYELEDAREKRRLYYRRARKRIAAQRKHRRATDPEWRQKENDRYRDWYNRTKRHRPLSLIHI